LVRNQRINRVLAREPRTRCGRMTQLGQASQVLSMSAAPLLTASPNATARLPT
jgi:hypothetical protein